MTTFEACPDCGEVTEIEEHGGYCSCCKRYLLPCSLCDMNVVKCNNCKFKKKYKRKGEK